MLGGFVSSAAFHTPPPPPPKRHCYSELFTAVGILLGRDLTNEEKAMLKILAEMG